ncbi:MAG: hypothetical protein JW878_00220 [Methanomicrobia archaeon]|nr:hypothetical protein [Methanomicrobia archaeon]
MKRAILLVVVLIVLTSVVSLAVGQSGIHEPGTEILNPELQEAGQGSEQGQQAGVNESGQGSTPQGQQAGLNETSPGTEQVQQEQVQQETQNIGENETIRVQQQEEVRAQNVSELHELVQQREQEMNQELQALDEHQQLVYQNQNRVRLAVQSLFAMEELVGGIGPQVSQIAEELNTSVQATIRAEERIQLRNTIVRFFAGGDEAAAQEIAQQVIQNQDRIRELQQLQEECDCDEEVRAILQEQIQNVEQEQTRLQQVAQSELDDKGLFGWLWK